MNRIRIKQMVCILLFAATCIAGCTTEYTIDDIKTYAEDRLSLKRVSVNKTAKEIKGEDGYTDILWTLQDEKNAITFHVLDDYAWGMESLSNQLRDDYDDCVFAAYVSELPTDTFTYDISTQNNLTKANIIAYYKTKADLQKCYEQLQDICSFFDMQGFDPMWIDYELRYENPIRSNVAGYEVHDGDCIGSLRNLKETTIEDFYARYLRCALDYRFADGLSEFSDQEIQSSMKNDESLMHVSINRNGKTEWYDDLVASTYCYGISFGTLYEILVKEGFAVTGTPEHYSFTGVDQSRYEISYDFNDLPYTSMDDDKEVQKGYYYLKDGEKIAMSAYFYNHFRPAAIKEMTGLEINDGRPQISN